MATFDPILTSARGVPIKPFIDIDWQGDVAAALMSAVARMGDYEVLLRTIGRKVVMSQKKNILEQRTPEGAGFAPLKKPRGKGRNPGSKALFDTGHLYDSIVYEPLNLKGATEVEVGFTDAAPYGRFQNMGTRFIPARRFVGIRSGDLPDIEQLAAAHITAAFSGGEADNP